MIDQPAVTPANPPACSATALTFAILALMSWMVPPVGGTLALIALALSWVATRAARAPGRYAPSGIPTAARVVAIIALVFASLVMLFWVLVAVAIANAPAGDEKTQRHHNPGEDAPQLW
jgi:hypothetical protein